MFKYIFPSFLPAVHPHADAAQEDPGRPCRQAGLGVCLGVKTRGGEHATNAEFCGEQCNKRGIFQQQTQKKIVFLLFFSNKITTNTAFSCIKTLRVTVSFATNAENCPVLTPRFTHLSTSGIFTLRIY